MLRSVLENMPTPKILLETPRLWLRSMQPDDVDALLNIFSDPKVMAAFDEPPFSRDQMMQWVQRNLDHQNVHGYGLFSVILKTNGLLIGDCGLELMDVDGMPAAELGYDFRSDYWNQGYATEAATAVRNYAFQQLQLPRLISLIRLGNVPSRRVAEKIGMQCTTEITRYGNRYWHYLLERKTTDKE
jgi:[ribosomal protein S5]-alanine N-acetyltransferase